MWLVVVGCALLLLLLVDVFLTVFHPQAHGGPLNRVQNRLVWSVTGRVARLRGGSGRDRLLSMAGPMLSAASLLLWAALVLTGFAFIYRAFPDGFAQTQFAHDFGWGDAFYYSGVAASTVGLGDVLAEPGPLRALTVIESLMGFMLITSAVTYILAVHQAEGNAASLALEVWAAFGDEPDQGARRLVSDLDRADLWAADRSRALSQVVTDQAQYPILHYFRPPDARQSIVVQAGSLLLLFEALDRQRPGWEEHTHLTSLRNITRRYLQELSSSFVRGSPIDVSEADDQELQKRHRQVLLHMGYDAGEA